MSCLDSCLDGVPASRMWKERHTGLVSTMRDVIPAGRGSGGRSAIASCSAVCESRGQWEGLRINSNQEKESRIISRVGDIVLPLRPSRASPHDV